MRDRPLRALRGPCARRREKLISNQLALFAFQPTEPEPKKNPSAVSLANRALPVSLPMKLAAHCVRMPRSLPPLGRGGPLTRSTKRVKQRTTFLKLEFTMSSIGPGKYVAGSPAAAQSPAAVVQARQSEIENILKNPPQVSPMTPGALALRVAFSGADGFVKGVRDPEYSPTQRVGCGLIAPVALGAGLFGAGATLLLVPAALTILWPVGRCAEYCGATFPRTSVREYSGTLLAGFKQEHLQRKAPLVTRRAIRAQLNELGNFLKTIDPDKRNAPKLNETEIDALCRELTALETCLAQKKVKNLELRLPAQTVAEYKEKFSRAGHAGSDATVRSNAGAAPAKCAGQVSYI